jgi:DNA-binding NarL/FixJ family response regulator
MRRLLIADDHLMFGSALVYLLQQLDPAVTTIPVGSVLHAVAQIEAGPPFDLVLLDHDMPGIDGMQGLKMIRQKFPSQIIAMLSGRTDAHLVKAALAAGATGWLPKTLSEEPLLHALRMLAAGGPFVPPEVLAELAKADDKWGDLSPTELKVARLLADGMTDKEIAQTLQLEPKTVQNHVRAILKKADVDNRTKFALAFREKP